MTIGRHRYYTLRFEGKLQELYAYQDFVRLATAVSLFLHLLQETLQPKPRFHLRQKIRTFFFLRSTILELFDREIYKFLKKFL